MKLPKSYRIKNRYILLESLNKKEFIKKFIYFFGIIEFQKASIKIIKIGKYKVLSVNKKSLPKVIFSLYLSNSKPLKLFKTIKSVKRFLKVT